MGLNRLHTIGLPLLVAAATLVGCAGTPPNASLEQARSAFAQASQNPQVAAAAPLPLQRARVALNQAETAYNSDEDPMVVNHYAYLATQETAIAEETSRLKAAQEQVDNAAAARNRVIAGAATARANRAETQAQQQAEELERLRSQVKDLKTQQTAQGTVLTLNSDILFNTGSATLHSGALPAIRHVADYLKQNPNSQVTVEGFTDSTGTAAFNQQLSEERANAVRMALVQDGVPESRIATRGMGESQPIASNDTTVGRQQNRRVQILVSNTGGAVQSGSSQPR